MLGKEVEILAEELIKYQEQDYVTGHTREYVKAMILKEEILAKPLVKAVVAEVVKNDAILVETL
jgi:threonylcarbamoyladenosine tRNA methylthiotransferase MtaB